MPALPEGETTYLQLVGVGVPPYSARGLSQTLDPIDASKVLRRTVNGEMKDISAPQFRKYKSTVTCTDQQAPALDGVWPGQELTVHCIAELSYPVGGAASRPVVAGSSRTESGYVFYRPQLEMVVMGYTTNHDEYGAAIGWTLELEEI